MLVYQRVKSKSHPWCFHCTPSVSNSGPPHRAWHHRRHADTRQVSHLDPGVPGSSPASQTSREAPGSQPVVVHWRVSMVSPIKMATKGMGNYEMPMRSNEPWDLGGILFSQKSMCLKKWSTSSRMPLIVVIVVYSGGFQTWTWKDLTSSCHSWWVISSHQDTTNCTNQGIWAHQCGESTSNFLKLAASVGHLGGLWRELPVDPSNPLPRILWQPWKP